MSDDIYWIHLLKRNESATEEECEKGTVEILMPMWVEITGCKDVFLLKAIQLPWMSGGRSQEFDYLWVSVWDRGKHRQFEARGGQNIPELHPFREKSNELNLGQLVGSLGSLELISTAKSGV